MLATVSRWERNAIARVIAIAASAAYDTTVLAFAKTIPLASVPSAGMAMMIATDPATAASARP
jgi:hypothetical protein